MFEQPAFVKIGNRCTPLAKSLEYLKSYDEDKMQDFMTRHAQNLSELGGVITPISRSNWEKEKECDLLEQKIKLLVKHQTTAADIERDSKYLNKGEKNSKAILGDNKYLYEKLFSLLQTNPEYLAQLSHLVKKKDREDFVQLVIFDIFGDLVNPQLETQLLCIFRRGLEIEFENKTLGTCFRDNRSLNPLLRAYALRGDGKDKILTKILAKPVREVFSQKNLILEIDVNRVYDQVVQKYESSTGKQWPRARKVPTKEANESPFVQQLCQPRIKQLKFICNHFLERIIGAVEKIPWGVRWVCKQIAELAQSRFPEADRHQIGGLVGSFIFLRIFNPAICAPDSQENGFVNERPSKITRKNLLLVGKVLQNLSNSIYFQEGELYMMPLNEFLIAKRDDMQNYFSKLIEVEDLEFRMELDALYNYHQNRPRTIRTTFNQIYLIHRLLVKHKKHFSDPNDPILPILISLGEVPESLPFKQNSQVALTIPNVSSEEPVNRLGDNIFSNLLQKNDNPDPAVEAATAALHEFSKQINHENYELQLTQFKRDFEGFLDYMIEQNNEDTAVAREVKEKVAIAVEAILENDSEMTTGRFIANYVNSIRHLHKCAKRLHDHVHQVQRALHALRETESQLEEKLNTFLEYLNNVKGTEGHHYKGNQTKPIARSKLEECTFSHQELVNQGVILSVSDEAQPHIKKIKYVFRQTSQGEFDIYVKAKAVFTFDVFKEPMKITMLDLLEMESRLQNQFTLKNLIVLNVNLLKVLLTKSFIGTN